MVFFPFSSVHLPPTSSLLLLLYSILGAGRVVYLGIYMMEAMAAEFVSIRRLIPSPCGVCANLKGIFCNPLFVFVPIFSPSTVQEDVEFFLEGDL